MGVLARADGSAYYEHGNTRIICAVYGPREAKSRAEALHDRCIISALLCQPNRPDPKPEMCNLFAYSEQRTF